MGSVKIGRPLTPTTIPAPSRMNNRYLVMMAAGRIDSDPSALRQEGDRQPENPSFLVQRHLFSREARLGCRW